MDEINIHESEAMRAEILKNAPLARLFLEGDFTDPVTVENIYRMSDTIRQKIEEATHSKLKGYPGSMHPDHYLVLYSMGFELNSDPKIEILLPDIAKKAIELQWVKPETPKKTIETYLFAGSMSRVIYEIVKEAGGKG